jgi:hypothetical protein
MSLSSEFCNLLPEGYVVKPNISIRCCDVVYGDIIEPDKSSVLQPTKLSDSVLYSEVVAFLAGIGLDSLVYAR